MEEIEPVPQDPSFIRQLLPQIGVNPGLRFMGVSRWPVNDDKLGKQGYLQKLQLLYGQPGKMHKTVQYYIDYSSYKLVHTGVGSGVPEVRLKDLDPRIAAMIGFKL